jgi:hypothetical protein
MHPVHQAEQVIPSRTTPTIGVIMAATQSVHYGGQ